METPNPVHPELPEAKEAPNFDNRAPAADVEMVHIFTLNEKEYFIPKKPRINIGLKYLHAVKTKGQNEAGMDMLSDLLGEENYLALIGYDELTENDLMTVMAIASDAVFGQPTLAPGN